MESNERNYRDLFTLMREEPEAKVYFDTLPASVQEKLSTHAFRVNSLQGLCQYADDFRNSAT